MNALVKVLVVDNGRRSETDLLSTELAELGLSSVTTSVEAAEEVLGVIERPAAIFLNMPAGGEILDTLRRLADTLRCSETASGIPVIEWTNETSLRSGGVSGILMAEIGPQALAGPEL